MRYKNAITKLVYTAVLICITLSTACDSPRKHPENGKASSVMEAELPESHVIAQFRTSGVPTPAIVDALVAAARKEDTIGSWTKVASAANSYANLIDVLVNHQLRIAQHAVQSADAGSVVEVLGRAFAEIAAKEAAEYEGVRDKYVQIRNDAYLNIAKLSAASGDTATAVAYVVTAIEHSSTNMHYEGKTLLKSFIHYRSAND